MKRLIIAAVAFSATTFTYAQTAIKSEAPATPNQETPAPVKTEAAAQIEPAIATDAAVTTTEDRKAVKIADLPMSIQAELGTKQYEGWVATQAFWVTGKDIKVEHYEITLVKDNESKMVKYNAEGSKLD